MSEAPITEEPIDLRAALEGAFAADDAAPAPVVEAPASAAQPRDESGKFAPKTDAPAISADQTIPTAPAAPAPEAQPEPIRPPASWSAQAKADFATLAPHIQQEVLKRETDVAKGFEERAAKLKQYEPLEAVLAPLQDHLALNGLDSVSYVRSLAAADQMLRGPNKVQALAQIAQQYGIDLRNFAQPGQAQQQPMAQLPSEFQTLAQQVAQLQQTVTTQLTASEQSAQAQTQAEIDAFAKDHLYFENVKPTMAALLKSGEATTLADAYDRACWARPDIRPLLQKEQADKAAQAQREAANVRVNGARQAAGNITGSPAPGAVPTRTGPAPSIRDALTEAMGPL